MSFNSRSPRMAWETQGDSWRRSTAGDVGPKMSKPGWHTAPAAGRVPLTKYALTAAAVQLLKPDNDVCCKDTSESTFV